MQPLNWLLFYFLLIPYLYLHNNYTSKANLYNKKETLIQFLYICDFKILVRITIISGSVTALTNISVPFNTSSNILTLLGIISFLSSTPIARKYFTPPYIVSFNKTNFSLLAKLIIVLIFNPILFYLLFKQLLMLNFRLYFLYYLRHLQEHLFLQFYLL